MLCLPKDILRSIMAGLFIITKTLETTQMSVVTTEWINYSKNWKTVACGQKVACHLFLYGQWPKKGFVLLRDVKKYIFCNMSKLNEIQISVSIKFYWNTATFICLLVVYGCFHATLRELSSCDREHLAHKT